MVKKCTLIILVFLALFYTDAKATSIYAYPECRPYDMGCDFKAFLESVNNGDASEITGVFVPGILEASVVQQPIGDTGYVANEDGMVTQFQLAERYGVIGLLGHVDRMGEYFHLLDTGDLVILVMGDGLLKLYRVVDKNEYQKLTPGSNWSNYRHTTTNEHFTTYQVFHNYYQTEKETFPVTLQTCIDKNGNKTWGLIFISAEPILIN